MPSCENIVVDTLTADECCHYLPYRFPFSVHRENDSVWVRIAEVVEIKSCCPFSLSHKGQQPSEWIYSCSGPRSAVPPMYIAQVGYVCSIWLNHARQNSASCSAVGGVTRPLVIYFYQIQSRSRCLDLHVGGRGFALLFCHAAHSLLLQLPVDC